MHKGTESSKCAWEISGLVCNGKVDHLNPQEQAGTEEH